MDLLPDEWRSAVVGPFKWAHLAGSLHRSLGQMQRTNPFNNQGDFRNYRSTYEEVIQAVVVVVSTKEKCLLSDRVCRGQWSPHDRSHNITLQPNDMLYRWTNIFCYSHLDDWGMEGNRCTWSKVMLIYWNWDEQWIVLKKKPTINYSNWTNLTAVQPFICQVSLLNLAIVIIMKNKTIGNHQQYSLLQMKLTNQWMWLDNCTSETFLWEIAVGFLTR